MQLGELPAAFLITLAICLGLLFGSFLNVVIHRLPRGMSVASPPSTCPACGSRIAPRDNVPVVSWLLLGGRARCCKARISARYPAIEALGGVMGWAVMQGLVLQLPHSTLLSQAVLFFIVYFALTMGLLAALFIDLEHLLLPDQITLGGTFLGLLTAPLRGSDFSTSALGGVVGFCMVWLPFIVLYRALRGQAGMGLGDAKLLALAGVWFGWAGALFVLLAGAVQGTLAAIALFVATGRIDEPEAVKREREELHAELAAMTPEQRARELERIDDDVLRAPPAKGLGGARLAFGPFLILSIFELLFLSESIERITKRWLFGY